MDEGAAPGCNLCGLYRLCLFGRVGGLRIRRVRYDRGTPVFRHGERVDALFMIRSGCLKEVEIGPDRHDSIVNFATAGEVLSLQSLETSPSNTTAIAVEPSFICVVPWHGSNQSSVIEPWVVGEFIQLIAKAGLKARESLALIRDKDAPQRVAGFLLNMLTRSRAHGARTDEFRLGMNRDDIGNYLGVRSETVSRCFTELARQQLIKVKAKRVQVLQVGALRRIFAGA